MEYDGSSQEFELPENDTDEFDEKAFEEAIRQYRRREFAELASLNN